MGTDYSQHVKEVITSIIKSYYSRGTKTWAILGPYQELKRMVEDGGLNAKQQEQYRLMRQYIERMSEEGTKQGSLYPEMGVWQDINKLPL
jgi:hypothetical protein